MRRGLTWLLVLPAIVVGSQLAHGIAYWWAYPVARLRLTALASSGHGYLAYAPAAIGFLSAVQAIAFAVTVLDKARGRPVRNLPAWVFLFIPMLGFLLQEHIERFLTSGVFPWWTVLEPSFWRGLVLQVPLGVAAYLVAAVLLRTATVVAGVVARRPAVVVVRQPRSRPRRPALVVLARRTPLAGLAADRAPPLTA
ncbi:MAG TPA: hypothetical protein VGN06_13545 [Gaiellaceae bacterium]